jgi:hypothetical protein
MEPYEINHDWVDPPKSIGSLSTMFLTLFFMRELN